MSDDRDNSMTILGVIFVLGMIWMFMHPANDAAGSPTEHKCWTDVGYESC